MRALLRVTLGCRNVLLFGLFRTCPCVIEVLPRNANRKNKANSLRRIRANITLLRTLGGEPTFYGGERHTTSLYCIL